MGTWTPKAVHAPSSAKLLAWAQVECWTRRNPRDCLERPPRLAGSKLSQRVQVPNNWVPLKGIYRGYISVQVHNTWVLGFWAIVIIGQVLGHYDY